MICFHVGAAAQIRLLLIYRKAIKDDLTATEKAWLRPIVENLPHEAALLISTAGADIDSSIARHFGKSRIVRIKASMRSSGSRRLPKARWLRVRPPVSRVRP